MRTSRIFRVVWRAALVMALLAVPAFGADRVVDIMQGEDASKVSGKRVEPVTVFYTNGRVEKSIRLDERATKLVVKADSGPKCGDQWPHMVVEIDGVVVLSTSVQENGFTAAPVNVAPGNHTVAVVYDNDYYEPVDAYTVEPSKPLTCDRNLHFDGIGLIADDNTDPAPVRRRTRRLHLLQRPPRHRRQLPRQHLRRLQLRPQRPLQLRPQHRRHSHASAGQRVGHPLEGRRREAVGRREVRPPLARQQRVGQLQL